MRRYSVLLSERTRLSKVSQRPWSAIGIFLLALPWVPVAYAYRGALIAVDQAQLKESASADAATKWTFPRGTHVNTSDQPTNGFYWVRSLTQSGWVLVENLDFGKDPPPPIKPSAPSSEQTKGGAYDITVVGSFESSNLSTNFNSGNDTVTKGSLTLTNGGLSSGTALGGGVIVSKRMTPMYSIETGLLYLPRSFSQSANITGFGTATANFSYTYWQIPLLTRVHFLDFYSFGLGGYFAHAVGNIKYTETATDALVATGLPTGTQYAGYEGSGVSRTDYGLLFAAGGKIPISDIGLSAYFDFRYAYGLKNINNGGVTTANPSNPPDSNKWHDLQLVAGLCFAL